MGCTSSRAADGAVVVAKHLRKNESLRSVSTPAFSNHSEREASSRTVKTGRTSSCGSNEDRIMPECRDDVDTTAIPRPKLLSLSSRNFSESSHLCDLRDEFATCELNKSVVRIETLFDTPIEEVYDGVLTGKVLGMGVSGTVRMITHRITGINYAVKCLDLSLVNTPESLKRLRDEINIMCHLDHPSVMRIEEVYESDNEIYLVQEICSGGDLFDRLNAQPQYHYTEEQCAKLVKQMLSSIRYLHSKGIIHRDLKLENFLFTTKDEDSDLKLIDFGLSKHFKVGVPLCEKVGTPYTVAPEILKGNYDEKCDMWSLGVITFLLLSGDTPFGGLDGENLQIVKQNIMRGQVSFEPENKWDHVSDEGKTFVKSLLCIDVSHRPTAKEAQRSNWIQDWSEKALKGGTSLNPKTIGALMDFQHSTEMQKLLSEVVSFTLLPEQIIEVRKDFEKLDLHGDGEITLGSLKRTLIQNTQFGSLGSLSEADVEEMFVSIKLPVRRAEPTIRWHEFLAANLSQSKLDDRNLRLAFDRLDTQRKGFITFDDLSDILGTTMDHEALEKIWKESISEHKSRLDRITLDDFKKIMNGRPKDGLFSCVHRFHTALCDLRI